MYIRIYLKSNILCFDRCRVNYINYGIYIIDDNHSKSLTWVRIKVNIFLWFPRKSYNKLCTKYYNYRNDTIRTINE